MYGGNVGVVNEARAQLVVCLVLYSPPSISNKYCMSSVVVIDRIFEK